jgi:Cytochrome c, mono- and diheme variants
MLMAMDFTSNERMESALSPSIKIFFCLVAGAALIIFARTPVLAQSAQGAALAQEYCAMCHAIGAAGSSPHSSAPPFRRLGDSYDLDKLRETLVRGTILPSHPDMPLFKMDGRTAREIVNYIRSIQE